MGGEAGGNQIGQLSEGGHLLHIHKAEHLVPDPKSASQPTHSPRHPGHGQDDGIRHQMAVHHPLTVTRAISREQTVILRMVRSALPQREHAAPPDYPAGYPSGKRAAFPVFSSLFFMFLTLPFL
ncbi:MAG: hypothetical protein ACLTTU_11015 [Bilophila wadsworthia]